MLTERKLGIRGWHMHILIALAVTLMLVATLSVGKALAGTQANVPPTTAGTQANVPPTTGLGPTSNSNSGARGVQPVAGDAHALSSPNSPDSPTDAYLNL